MMPNLLPVSLGTSKGAFFVLKTVEYTPLAPKVGEALEITGEITLFGFRFIGPVWVIAYVTYPKEWWQEIIKISGAKEARVSALVTGGKFDLFFDEGFEKEGTYTLVVSLYGGPTLAVAPAGVSTFTLPPIPAIANYKTTFTVSGGAAPGPSPAPGGTGVSLGSLRISPESFFKDDEVTITCPVTSLFQTKQEGTLVFEIHETSLLRNGDLINTVVSSTFAIDPGQSLDVSVKWKGAGAEGGKDLWVYFKQATTKYSAQYYGSVLTMKKRSDAGSFTILEPSVDRREVVAGDKVNIVIPIMNNLAQDQQVQITMDIYAPVNQLDIGNGNVIYTKTVPAMIKGNTTYNAQFEYLTTVSNDDRRYVGAKVAWGGTHWVDNVFKGLPQPVFTVTKAGEPTPVGQQLLVRTYRPQISPPSAPIGTTINIQCPVKLESGVATQIKVKCTVHESAWGAAYLTKTGDWLWENYQTLSISPGQTVAPVFQYPINGAIGTKDVIVEVYSTNSIQLKDSNAQNTFEDIITATSGPALPPYVPPPVQPPYVPPPVVVPSRIWYTVTQHGLAERGAAEWRVEHFEINHNMDFYSDYVPVSQASIQAISSAWGNIGIAYRDATWKDFPTFYDDPAALESGNEYIFNF